MMVLLTIFDFVLVWKQYTLSRNRVWDFECGPFPGLAVRGPVLSHDAGGERRRSVAGSPVSTGRCPCCMAELGRTLG